jgi:hypothetical protein
MTTMAPPTQQPTASRPVLLPTRQHNNPPAPTPKTPTHPHQHKHHGDGRPHVPSLSHHLTRPLTSLGQATPFLPPGHHRAHPRRVLTRACSPARRGLRSRSAPSHLHGSLRCGQSVHEQSWPPERPSGRMLPPRGTWPGATTSPVPQHLAPGLSTNPTGRPRPSLRGSGYSPDFPNASSRPNPLPRAEGTPVARSSIPTSHSIRRPTKTSHAAAQEHSRRGWAAGVGPRTRGPRSDARRQVPPEPSQPARRLAAADGNHLGRDAATQTKTPELPTDHSHGGDGRRRASLNQPPMEYGAGHQQHQPPTTRRSRKQRSTSEHP